MSLWIRVVRPQIESGHDLTAFESAVINLEQVEAFALGEGLVACFIDGKGYYIRQSDDPTAFQTIIVYVRKITNLSL